MAYVFVLDAADNIIARKSFPQIANSWNRLFEMLMGAIGADKYHLRKDLQDVSRTEDGVTAHFADGTSQTMLVSEIIMAVNDRDYDVALHIAFESRAAHDAYQAAPRHQQFIDENRATREGLNGN